MKLLDQFQQQYSRLRQKLTQQSSATSSQKFIQKFADRKIKITITSLRARLSPAKVTSTNMGSSSNRNTRLELTLTNHCRNILAHLMCGSLYAEQDVLIPAFADLLDMDAAGLERMYMPRIESGMSAAEKERVISIKNAVKEMQKASRRKKQSERLWDVSSRCSDIGFCLNQTGKAREAVQWCQWSAELHGMALDQARFEERT